MKLASWKTLLNYAMAQIEVVFREKNRSKNVIIFHVFKVWKTIFIHKKSLLEKFSKYLIKVELVSPN